MMEEQGAREIRHVGVRRIDVASGQREELLFDRQNSRDELWSAERCAAHAWVPAKPMPQAKELPLQGQRLVTKPFRRWRLGEFLGAQHVSGEVRPMQTSA